MQDREWGIPEVSPLAQRRRSRAGHGVREVTWLVWAVVAAGLAVGSGAFGRATHPAGQGSSGRPIGNVVDLNTADASTLQLLPGVGQTAAERIVAHRQNYGPFASQGHLLRVTGVGAGTVARVSPLVSPGPAGRD